MATISQSSGETSRVIAARLANVAACPGRTESEQRPDVLTFASPTLQ
jgi:hypothetical protein